MADITKCAATNCHLAESCWCKQAPSNTQWQSYQDFSLYMVDSVCDFYVKSPDASKTSVKTRKKSNVQRQVKDIKMS